MNRKYIRLKNCIEHSESHQERMDAIRQVSELAENDLDCLIYEGYIQEIGLGHFPHSRKAFATYVKAAMLSPRDDVLCNLGLCFERFSSNAHAVKCYQVGYKNGHVRSTYNLARLQYDSDSEALNKMNWCFLQGDYQAGEFLASYEIKGQAEQATIFEKLYEEFGHADALHRLGYFVKEGYQYKRYTSQDCIEIASKKGSRNAHFSLAKGILSGKFEGDSRHALNCLRDCSFFNMPGAHYLLGYHLWHGANTEQDKGLGAKHLLFGGELGCKEASQVLVAIYEQDEVKNALLKYSKVFFQERAFSTTDTDLILRILAKFNPELADFDALLERILHKEQ